MFTQKPVPKCYSSFIYHSQNLLCLSTGKQIMALWKSTQEKKKLTMDTRNSNASPGVLSALEHYLSNLHSNGSRKNYLCPILANLKLFQKEKK